MSFRYTQTHWQDSQGRRLNSASEFSCHVAGLFALADPFEARQAAAQWQVDALTPDPLDCGFLRQLPHQGPNDEPASASLARLRKTQDCKHRPGESRTSLAANRRLDNRPQVEE